MCFNMQCDAKDDPISDLHPFKLVVSKHLRERLRNATNWIEIST